MLTGTNNNSSLKRKIRKMYKHPVSFVKDSQAVKVLEPHKIKKKILINKLFFGILVLPMLLASIYYAFIASDKYASEAKIIVKSIGSNNQIPLGLAFVTGASGSHGDALLVEEYVSSMAMFQYLKSELAIDQHYTSDYIDFLEVMPKDAPIEDQLAYFKEQVNVSFDEKNSILTLEAIAFDPETAQVMLKKIIDKSEEFINYVDISLSQEQYNFVNNEMKHIQLKLKKAKEAIRDFSQTHNIVDPESESQAMSIVVNKLKAELTTQEAELKTLLGYMNPNSQEVIGIKNRIDAIKKQLSKESKSYSGVEDESLSHLRSQYHSLVLDFEFAQEAYKVALATLEKIRVETYQKKKYLIRVTEPYRPEYSKYPNKLKSLATILFVLFLVFGTITLVVEIVKENME